MGEQGRLAADDRAGIADPADRFAHHVGLQLLPVVEMRHDRDMAARPHDILEQPQHAVGILVVDEAVRPEGERLGADPDVLDMLQRRIVDEGPEIAFHHPGLHDHGVAAGHQQVRDVRVGGEIAVQAFGVLGRDFQLLVADELGPAKTEGAIGVTGLPLAREEQHGLAVFVLQSLEDLVLLAGNVELPLAGRMGIEAAANLGRRQIDLMLRRPAQLKVGDPAEFRLAQHLPLRKNQLVDRVVGNPVPVDQVFDDIAVGAEREHRTDDAHGEQVVIRHIAELGDGIEVPCSQCPKLAGRRLDDPGRKRRAEFRQCWILGRTWNCLNIHSHCLLRQTTCACEPARARAAESRVRLRRVGPIAISSAARKFAAPTALVRSVASATERTGR